MLYKSDSWIISGRKFICVHIIYINIIIIQDILHNWILTIVVIEDGKIVEMGKHHELMTRNGHYAYLYEQQQLQDREGVTEPVNDQI